MTASVFAKKLKAKINCNVDKLMIVTKRITNFNVISFNATTSCSLLEFQKPFATNQDLLTLYNICTQ